MTQFEQLVDEFLNARWEHDPVMATGMGVHRYDHRLPDRCAEAMEEWGQRLEGFRQKFEVLDPAALSRQEQIDRRWALAAMDYELLNHELEPWRQSPQATISDVGEGVHSLLSGAFAPPEQRFEAVLARLQAIPDLIETACQALQPERIPPVWIESSLPNARAARRFIADEVPRAAEQVPALAGEIEAACERAALALADLERFLREAAAVAQGDYAIGRERFDRILGRFHMLDMDSDDLYEFGREWIDRYERQMVEVAREIDPDGDWVSALEAIKDDHPTPEGLRQAYEDETMLARRHCTEHDLITFPEGESCVLEWTPGFMRASVPIALPRVSPAFEPGLHSKWYITPVDPEAPSERQRQHIRDNSWPWIRGIAMHEIYPGHHLQFMIAKQVATPIRLSYWSPVLGEGWGLYTEELFYETGLLAPPRFRLMQLRNGLWRAVRIIVDVGLHARGMTVPEAAGWLVERARLEPRWAESETRYYTTRPTYPSSYQVGFALLMDLRARYRDLKGPAFTLKAFHDELLSYSTLPLKIVAEEMLEHGAGGPERERAS